MPHEARANSIALAAPAGVIRKRDLPRLAVEPQADLERGGPAGLGERVGVAPGRLERQRRCRSGSSSPVIVTSGRQASVPTGESTGVPETVSMVSVGLAARSGRPGSASRARPRRRRRAGRVALGRSDSSASRPRRWRSRGTGPGVAPGHVGRVLDLQGLGAGVLDRDCPERIVDAPQGHRWRCRRSAAPVGRAGSPAWTAPGSRAAAHRSERCGTAPSTYVIRVGVIVLERCRCRSRPPSGPPPRPATTDACRR